MQKLVLLAKLIMFFFIQSLAGGWDVARRAFQKNIRLESEFIDYKLRLPPGKRRTLWITMIGLFPGTLSVALQGDSVCVHVLDKRLDVMPSLQRFEDYLLSWEADGAFL